MTVHSTVPIEKETKNPIEKGRVNIGAVSVVFGNSADQTVALASATVWSALLPKTTDTAPIFTLPFSMGFLVSFSIGTVEWTVITFKSRN